MDQLFAKLSDLTYEIFGIILPGLLGILFLATLWWSLGTVPFELSSGFLPKLSLSAIHALSPSSIDMAALLFGSYFVGHLLNWLSRTHGKHCDGRFASACRVFKCLIFRIPRPKGSYHDELDPVFAVVAAKLGLPEGKSRWRQFYPLAKIIISERLSHSLVSMYQNKYTLHRSITGAAALWFWTSLAALLFCAYGSPPLSPRWVALLLNPPAALLVVWGFSDSFAYYWRMFGDSAITETYALLGGLTTKP